MLNFLKVKDTIIYLFLDLKSIRILKMEINNINNLSNNAYNNYQNIKKQMIINQLKTIEKKVIAHEMAHKSVGGELAGPVNYKYAVGPDGKRYIVGGEVPIKIRKGKTPEETIKIAQKIKAAALAPANPSPQDLKVAAQASLMEIKARMEMQAHNKEEKKGKYINLFI